MLKKLRNSLVVLFLLGAIVLPLSQPNSFANSTASQNDNGIVQCGVIRDQHDIN